MLPKPREAEVEVINTNRKFRSELGAADRILKRRLDSLVAKLQKAAPDFLTKYRAVRLIVDLARNRSAAPSPAPVSVPAT